MVVRSRAALVSKRGLERVILHPHNTVEKNVPVPQNMSKCVVPNAVQVRLLCFVDLKQ